ncbi:dephospho-CoA kinase [Litoreibacter janthinus]|uniref:Dephospho-CoA kinase n=1 Tax=Litoreibacter janthinus TaxID=670154 RepID=A0A1I6FZG0_9RHOB|nr:dephospho-CoA kinase [Litoreibacter janthinus]SFR35343.1 dephospho-CoA kinase [Litoreibacter janthinus]
MTKNRIILGLTGSIGMGKSTTAQMFRDLGVPVWDADHSVSELYSKDGSAIAGLSAINPEFVTEGTANRAAMKRAIAADPNVLAQIETLVHPLVRASREAFLADHADDDLVVLDIPLLFETGAQEQVDLVLVVTAPAAVQHARVIERGTMTPEMFEAILVKQVPDTEKRAQADFVIETLALEDTKADVTSLVEELRGRHA